jgi:hypothetical protein
MSDSFEGNHVFYASFLNKQGDEAQISGSPTITISHFDNQSVIVDIDKQSMFLVNGGNYVYNWDLPKADSTKSFNVTYRAYYDDSEVVGCETFTLQERGISKKIMNLSKEISLLDSSIRNERLTLIISELEDLHKEFEDFKKAFVLSLSDETRQRVLESLNYENDRVTA